MFNLSAAHYDAIYSFKDYAAEAKIVHEVAERYKQSPGNDLLDVACGTGHHLEHLQDWYRCEGLDIEKGLLDSARARLPSMPLHQGDMASFHLGRTFDVVTCLFSAIGYLTEPDALSATLNCMAEHMKPGAALLVEPWFQPHEWRAGRPHMTLVDEPELKIARMNVSETDGDLSICHFHYLVGTPAGVKRYEERHVLRLVTHEETGKAFEAAGLSFDVLEPGPSGRGLFVGVKPD